MNTDDLWYSSIQKMNDESLISVFVKKNEFAEDYIAAIEEELVFRGYDVSSITSPEDGMRIFLKQKTDLELYSLLHDKKNTFLSKEIIRNEIEARNLSEVVLRDQSIEQGKEGNDWLLIAFPLLGSVIVPIIVFFARGRIESASVLTLIALFMAIYYLVAFKKLSSGKLVKTYNKQTRHIAKIVLILILVLMLFNTLIFFRMS